MSLLMNDLAVAHPQSGSVYLIPGQITINFGSVVFEGRGKPAYPEKILSEQRREPTTNSTHILRRRWDSNPDHTGRRRALSPLHHPLLIPWLARSLVEMEVLFIEEWKEMNLQSAKKSNPSTCLASIIYYYNDCGVVFCQWSSHMCA